MLRLAKVISRGIKREASLVGFLPEKKQQQIIYQHLPSLHLQKMIFVHVSEGG